MVTPLASVWPLENRELDQDYKEEDSMSSGLVYHIDTWDWRLKSPDEINNTKDEDHIVKYDIENDLVINFKKVDDEFDPEKLSIYRVSITPFTQGSIIKQISVIKNMGVQFDKQINFEDDHDIVFIKTNVDVFDNTQVDRNQIFLVSTPYTIFLW